MESPAGVVTLSGWCEFGGAADDLVRCANEHRDGRDHDGDHSARARCVSRRLIEAHLAEVHAPKTLRSPEVSYIAACYA